MPAVPVRSQDMEPGGALRGSANTCLYVRAAGAGALGARRWGRQSRARGNGTCASHVVVELRPHAARLAGHALRLFHRCCARECRPRNR
eukprot:8104745-Alexandrium_andersonii.AAC.1